MTPGETAPDPRTSAVTARPARRSPVRLLAAVLLLALGAAAATACEPLPPGGKSTDPGLVAVAAARQQIGQPYVTGGESRAEGGFDCSGLTYYAWKQAGAALPRSSSAQYTWATKISKSQLKPGDLVFYSSSGSTGSVSHVALYSGNGKIIQAHKPGVPLSEDDLATYWVGHLVGYGRVPASAIKPTSTTTTAPAAR